MSNNGWIAVDLDGVLAEYYAWPADGSIGKPIPVMVERVKRWLAEGKEVRIFTARVWPIGTITDGAGSQRLPQADDQFERIQDWCEKYLGQVLPITCIKDFRMIELWDDRAVQVEPNTGRRVDNKEN